MNALYATLRPAWRPSTLFRLAGVWFIVVSLLQIVPDVSEAMPVLRAVWLGTATPAMMTALWVVVLIAPAGVGLVLAADRLDLQHTALSWHLPGLRRRLLGGTVVCGLVVASALAVLVARSTRSSGATIAAFSIAFCAFLAPGFILDRAVMRPLRLLVALPLIAAVAMPGSTAAFAHDIPLFVTALASALAVVQLISIVSGSTARIRPFRWSRLRSSGPRALYWAERKTRRSEWRSRLASARLLTWLRAASYESGALYPLPDLGAAAMCVLFVRLFEFPLGIPLLAGAFFLKSGTQLRMQVPYPLSRVRRARLAYAGSVIDAVTYFLFVGLLLYATELVPPPHLPGVDWAQPRPLVWVLAWGCSLALAPIAQWRLIARPHEDLQRLTGAQRFGLVAWLFGYALLVILAAGQINVATRSTGGLDSALIATGILMVVTQAIHAAMVYGYFTRSDLVRTQDTG